MPINTLCCGSRSTGFTANKICQRSVLARRSAPKADGVYHIIGEAIVRYYLQMKRQQKY